MNQKAPDPVWQRRFRSFDRLRTAEGQRARDELFNRALAVCTGGGDAV